MKTSSWKGALVAAMLVTGMVAANAQSKLTPAQEARAKSALGSVSNSFVENGGQWNASARFLARTPGADVWITKDGFRIDHFRSVAKNGKSGFEGHVVGIDFEGANKASRFSGEGKSLGTTGFYRRNPKNGAYASSDRFGSVWNENLYRGIGLRTYLDQGQVRYDFHVKPGADPKQIRLRLRGINNVQVLKDGSLAYNTSVGQKKHGRLLAYQLIGGKKRAVSVAFNKVDSNRVAFRLGAYDRSRELVIDPLIYGVYVGGDRGIDEATAVAADSEGNTYIVGITKSPRFPILFGPYGFNSKGGWDGFLARLQGDAYNNDYAAYIGGSNDDYLNKVSVDPQGNVWVAGRTDSPDFPAANMPSGVGTANPALFAIRFAPSNSEVLSPTVGGVNQGFAFGGAGVKYLTGFSIVPSATPVAGDPVRLVFAGTAFSAVPELSGTVKQGFVLTFDYAAGALTLVPATSLYVGDAADVVLNGLAVDQQGAVYVSGTVLAVGNQDTATASTPAFVTTGGVYAEGRLSRGYDIFVRKYNANGSVGYSTLIGGSGDDGLQGVMTLRFITNEGAITDFVGSTLAVDAQGNAYVAGLSRSFNFPRTRGVYGEVFSGNGQLVTVTKLNGDASQILYSTHLRASGGPISVSGLSIDSSGAAFVTGMVGSRYTFPDTAGDPNQPTANDAVEGQITTTSDALRTENTFPANPDMWAQDGFLLVLNPSATNLTYGTYIGANLEDKVYAPYTDAKGDVWVVGYNEQYRGFVRVSSTGTPTFYNQVAQLGSSFITDRAFKESPEFQGVGGTTYDEITNNYGYAYWSVGGAASFPNFINGVATRGDGFALKFRLSLPAITSLVFSPSSIPGGDAAGTGTPPSTVGTVTLSQAAPAGGVTVNLSLNSASASFSASTAQSTASILIPAGATTGTFTVYGRPVSDNVNVQVRAEYEGNFKIASIVIVPWLQQVTLAPSAVVGGNTAIGRVTIAQPAPAGGIQVALSTSNTTSTSLPGGTVMTIPAGQSSASFTIDTNGVDTNEQSIIIASILGLGKSQTLTIIPARLNSMTFIPQRLAWGSSTTGTLVLDGEAATPFTVTLTPSVGDVTVSPSTLTFLPGESFKTFTVTADEGRSDSVSRTITASRTGTSQSVVGTIFIDGATLSTMTLSPNVVDGGQTSTGTVSIAGPAPAGGVKVYILSSNAAVAASSTPFVLIPEGQTTGSFEVNTAIVATNQVVQIGPSLNSAGPSIGALRRNLTVRGVSVTLGVDPTSLVGGQTGALAYVGLSAIAPPSGIVVNLTSSNSAVVQVPSSITISGTSLGLAPITTSAVSTITTVTVRASIAGGAQSLPISITVRPVGLASLTFSPRQVRALGRTTLTVTLDAPAPTGGATVNLRSNVAVLGIPSSVTIPAGARSASVQVVAVRVARNTTASVTATYNGSTVSSSVTVIR